MSESFGGPCNVPDILREFADEVGIQEWTSRLDGCCYREELCRQVGAIDVEWEGIFCVKNIFDKGGEFFKGSLGLL